MKSKTRIVPIALKELDSSEPIYNLDRKCFEIPNVKTDIGPNLERKCYEIPNAKSNIGPLKDIQEANARSVITEKVTLADKKQVYGTNVGNVVRQFGQSLKKSLSNSSQELSNNDNVTDSLGRQNNGLKRNGNLTAANSPWNKGFNGVEKSVQDRQKGNSSLKRNNSWQFKKEEVPTTTPEAKVRFQEASTVLGRHFESKASKNPEQVKAKDELNLKADKRQEFVTLKDTASPARDPPAAPPLPPAFWSSKTSLSGSTYNLNSTNEPSYADKIRNSNRFGPEGYYNSLRRNNSSANCTSGNTSLGRHFESNTVGLNRNFESGEIEQNQFNSLQRNKSFGGKISTANSNFDKQGYISRTTSLERRQNGNNRKSFVDSGSSQDLTSNQQFGSQAHLFVRHPNCFIPPTKDLSTNSINNGHQFYAGSSNSLNRNFASRPTNEQVSRQTDEVCQQKKPDHSGCPSRLTAEVYLQNKPEVNNCRPTNEDYKNKMCRKSSLNSAAAGYEEQPPIQSRQYDPRHNSLARNRSAVKIGPTTFQQPETPRRYNSLKAINDLNSVDEKFGRQGGKVDPWMERYGKAVMDNTLHNRMSNSHQNLQQDFEEKRGQDRQTYPTKHLDNNSPNNGDQNVGCC